MPRIEKKNRAAQKSVQKNPPNASVKRNPPSDFLTLRKGAREIKPVVLERETPYPIKNDANELLVGVLHEPKRPSSTLVIAAHGFLSGKERPGIKQVCIELARAGFAAYRFDFSGYGDSEGRFEDATPRKLLNDLKSVFEHFRKRYARIVLYGRSLGAMLSLLLASVRAVEGVISFAAPMHVEQTFLSMLTPQQREQLRSVGFTTVPHKTAYGDVPFTLKETFVQELREVHPLDAARNIKAPVLIVHGTADTIVPASDGEELFAALSNRELFIIGGADHHAWNPAHLDALIARIIEWLRAH